LLIQYPKSVLDGMAAQNQSGVIETALAIARERSTMLEQIRALLEAGDEVGAVNLMKRYCGMSDDKKSHRAN
jgi:hypothetical protein